MKSRMTQILVGLILLSCSSSWGQSLTAAEVQTQQRVTCAKTTYGLHLAPRGFVISEDGEIRRFETTGAPDFKPIVTPSYSLFGKNGLEEIKDCRSVRIMMPERTADYLLNWQLTDALFGTNSARFYPLHMQQGIASYNLKSGQNDFYELTLEQRSELVNSCLRWALTLTDQGLAKRLLDTPVNESLLDPELQKIRAEEALNLTEKKARADADARSWHNYAHPNTGGSSSRE